ncbi:MAG: GntR family transcriptional regulator [Spirochaetales bacterium]|nr:GntR family transcriptional regulator [Spirochaetales bacterium]
MIHQQSPVPLYRQLALTIEQQIDAGVYTPGGRIPSEHDLVRAYSLGRPTVRQALEYLVRQGRVIKIQGKGTFVCEKTEAIDLFSLAGTSAAFLEKGISVERRLLGNAHIISVSGTRQQPFSGKDALFLQRIFFVKKNPILADELWIDHLFFPGIETTDFSDTSLSAVIRQRYFMTPDTCAQTFSLEVPPDSFRKKLQTGDNQPLLLVKRSLGFGGHAHAIYSHLWCRTDMYQFSQTIKGK